MSANTSAMLKNLVVLFVIMQSGLCAVKTPTTSSMPPGMQKKAAIKAKKAAVPNPLHASIAKAEQSVKNVKDAAERETLTAIIDSLKIVNKRFNVFTRKIRSARKKKSHLQKKAAVSKKAMAR